VGRPDVDEDYYGDEDVDLASQSTLREDTLTASGDQDGLHTGLLQESADPSATKGE
jgi:hypothetical protein